MRDQSACGDVIGVVRHSTPRGFPPVAARRWPRGHAIADFSCWRYIFEMLNIRPGSTIQLVHDQLNRAITDLQNVQNTSSPNERALSYFAWGADANRILSPLLARSDIELLILRSTYWHLLPIANFEGGRHRVLDVEIEQQLSALQVERDALAKLIEAARSDAASVAVVDTNVVMTHFANFGAVGWHERMGVFPNLRVRVLIPALVLDELDNLKRSQGNMILGGDQIPRRTVARQAIRSLARLFVEPGVEQDISAEDADGHPEPAVLALLMDPPNHVRLTDPDSEIRDRAVSLQPYASSVTFFSYDIGNVLAAKTMGLNAVRLIDEEDNQLFEKS